MIPDLLACKARDCGIINFLKMDHKLIWDLVRREALGRIKAEPLIKKVVQVFLEEPYDFWSALSALLAQKLASVCLDLEELKQLILSTIESNNTLKQQIISDLNAHFKRDFASTGYLDILLFARGFQGLTAHRIGASLMANGLPTTAYLIQQRIFEIYGMDIHPKAKFGKGIVLDHGIGLVIGETSEIGDQAFILHNVTLGSTGKVSGDRHPKLGSNVFIGAGALILGNIKVHEGANIAAGSVVTKEVPPYTTVAGVPARIIGEAKPLQ